VACLIAMTCLLRPPGAAAQRAALPPFRIAALKAMLFYGETGTFSPDLFGPSAPALQNVGTGEGQANATVVVVEISGRPDTYAPERRVALDATAGGRLLLRRTQGIGRPNDDSKFHVGFWLYDTPCVPLVIRVRITGQTEDSAMQKTLNFRCGD